MALRQSTYNIGNDNATGGNPDTCTFDGADTPRTDQTLEENFMIRLGVANTTPPANNRDYTLWYNTEDNATTATQVTTTSSVVAISAGTITDGANCTVELCTAQPETFEPDGVAIDESNSTGSISLASNDNIECQFSVQFDLNATDDTNYYFYIRENGNPLSSNLAAQVRTKPASSSSSSSSSISLSSSSSSSQSLSKSSSSRSSSSISSSSSSRSSSSISSSSATPEFWQSYMMILSDYMGVYSPALIQAFANSFSISIQNAYPDEWAEWDADGQIQTWYWFEDDDLPKYQYMPNQELSEEVTDDDEPHYHYRIIRSVYDLQEERYTGMYFMTETEMIWGSNTQEIPQS